MKNQFDTLKPIGVMDSGLGGLSVWRELVKIMPDENYQYFADSSFCPYGSKDPEDILTRVKKIVGLLIDNNCKLIVVACNAITATAIEYLRNHFSIPFVGMEPAIKPGLLQTKTKIIGVLATERTLKGDLFNNTKAKHGKGIKIVEQIGNGLVEKVENIDFNSDSTIALLRKYLAPMLSQNIDVLVLGCTHYPFLQASIKKIVGNKVEILNPAPAIARQSATILDKMQLKLNDSRRDTKSTFFTTGDPQIMIRMLKKFKAADHDVRAVTL